MSPLASTEPTSRALARRYHALPIFTRLDSAWHATARRKVIVESPAQLIAHPIRLLEAIEPCMVSVHRSLKAAKRGREKMQVLDRSPMGAADDRPAVPRLGGARQPFLCDDSEHEAAAGLRLRPAERATSTRTAGRPATSCNSPAVPPVLSHYRLARRGPPQALRRRSQW